MHEKKYLIALLSAALNRKDPPERPAGLDEGALLSLARAHGVAAAVSNFFPENPGFAEEKLKAISRDIAQQQEISRILAAFSPKTAVLLKGAVLKPLWPQDYMRTMGDIDILVEKQDMPRLTEVMRGLGYTVKNSPDNKVVSFHKKPIFNVELHTVLIWGVAALENTFNPGLQFVKGGALCPEAEYAYLFAHLAKHFAVAGCGIRQVADVYVLAHNLPQNFDRKKAGDLLESAGILAFAQNILRLAEVWFNGKAATEADAELARYILSSATYGDSEKLALGKRGKKSIAAAVLAHTFLPYSQMARIYPVLKKAKILLPFAWLHRIFMVITGRRGSCSGYIKQIKGVSGEGSAHHIKQLKGFGINF